MQCTGSRSPLFEMRRFVIASLLALLPLAGFAGPEERRIPAPAAGQESDGRALIDENCLYCHDDSYIRSLHLPREEWEGILDMMIGMGMPPLDPEVQEQILDYLGEEHGPRETSPSSGAAPFSGASAGAEDLPWAFPRYRPNPLYWLER